MKPAVDLHAFYSPLESETRLFKQAAYVHSQPMLRLRLVALGLREAHLEAEQCHPSGLQIVRLGRIWPWLRKTGFVKNSRWLRRVVALAQFGAYGLRFLLLAMRNRPAFVTCHHLSLLPLSSFAAVITGAVHVFAPHEWESERTGLGPRAKVVARWIERHFLHQATHHVFVNEPIRQWYASTYGLPQTHVVRAIPDVEFNQTTAAATRASVRARLGIPLDATVMIYQGLIDKARGIPELLNAFTQSNKTNHLLLMGYGDEVESVQQLSRHNHHIHYLSAVTRVEILNYTSIADIGIFTVPEPLSKSYQFSLPNKFFEYVFAHLPIIVTSNLTHLSELVETNQLGLVIKPADISHLPNLNVSLINSLRSNVQSYRNTLQWDQEASRYHVIYKR